MALAIAGVAEMSAHRRDEYLQAARLSIDPDRVEIELDLTPGIAVAEDILADIDLDRDRSISAHEAGAYSARVLSALALEIDGTPLRVEFVDSAFPTMDAVLKGEGTARLRAVALMPNLPDGAHRLRYRNSYRSDIGVYLANALVPASSRVTVTAQRRDVDQHDLTVDYIVRADGILAAHGWVYTGIGATLICVVILWWLGSRPRRAAVRTASQAGD